MKYFVTRDGIERQVDKREHDAAPRDERQATSQKAELERLGIELKDLILPS